MAGTRREAFTFATVGMSWKVRPERNLNGKGTGRCEVSKVANTYWIDERIRAQRVAPRASSLASVQQISIDILGTRTEVRRRGGIIPSWVVFGMILLATFAVCVTVNMRTRAKVQVAAQQLTVYANGRRGVAQRKSVVEIGRGKTADRSADHRDRGSRPLEHGSQ
jgi:hypothetical protein